MNHLNEQLELFLEKNFEEIHNSNFKKIKYIGRLFGMVYSGDSVSKEETLKRLSSAKTFDELIEIIRFIVGDIWFFLKDDKNIYLISTISAHPYFFYSKDKKLYFSKLESEICKIAVKNGEKINPYDLYDIFTTSRCDTAAYGGLFKNIRRIPGGHFLTINKKHNLSYYCYLDKKPKNTVGHDYKSFKRIFEATAKCFVNSGEKIYVFFSGGIDSFDVLLALRCSSNQIYPFSCTKSFDGEIDGNASAIREKMEIVKEIFDIDVELVHENIFSKSQRNNCNQMCNLMSCNSVKWCSYIWHSAMDKYKNERNCFFITGQTIDSEYGVENTEFSLFPFPKSYLNKAKRRYFYTKAYQQGLKGPINTIIRNKYIKSGDIDTKVEYFYSMLYYGEFQKDGLPFIKNKNHYLNDPFFKRYIEYKEENFLKTTFKDIEEIKNLPKNEVNRKIRLLRHYLGSPNIWREVYCVNHYSGHYITHLPGQGPIVDFFREFQLGWRDLLIPKRFLHKYFRDVTGREYTFEFSPYKIRRYASKVLRDIKGDKPKIIKITMDKFLSSKTFKDDFNKYIDLENPSVLKYLDDKYVEKFVKKFYEKAKNGLLKYDSIQDIYNMEVFIKNLEK